MISIIFFIHDPFCPSLRDFTSLILAEAQLSITSSHMSSSFSFLTISLQFFYLPKQLIWTISLIQLAPLQPSLSFLFKLLYLLYSSCFNTSSYSSQYCFGTSPCVHLFSLKLPPSHLHFTMMYLPLLLSPSSPPPLFPHTSSHAFKTPSLKCPLKFVAPTSTNLITFSSNHFLIFTSFRKLITLLSVHIFFTSFLIYF